MPLPQCYIVVPCYNEQKRLDCDQFVNFLSQHQEVSFLFVNDGSKDGTLELLQAMGKKCSRIEVLNLSQNGGKAEAIRQGMLFLNNKNVECLGYWDADLATPLDEIPRFLIESQNRPNYKLLIGSRWKHLGAQIERKTQRHFIGRIFATLASLILGLSVYDTQCGAKILRKELVNDLFSQPFITYWIFDVELFFRLRNSNHFKNNTDCILEIPLRQWQDKAGSKLKIWDFLKAPLELWKIFIHYKK